MADGGAGGRDPETVRTYWLSQWDRIGRLEDQRLQFSNFVIAASVVAIGLNVGADTSSSTAVLVLGAVAASNLMAWLYSSRSDRWVDMHRRRADLLVEENWSYIDDLRCRVVRPSGRFPMHGHTIHIHRGLHVVMALATVALAVATLMDG